MVQFLVKIFLIFNRFDTTVLDLDETIILDNKATHWWLLSLGFSIFVIIIYPRIWNLVYIVIRHIVVHHGLTGLLILIGIDVVRVWSA